MSASTPRSVCARLELRLVLAGDRAARVPCRLDYEPAAPFEVTATFGTADGHVTWVFARDLVRAGLERPSGDGDVAVWPSRSPAGEVVCLSLASPTGRALLEADRSRLARFLASTEEVVPVGEESAHLDLDAVIDRLLAG